MAGQAKKMIQTVIAGCMGTKTTLVITVPPAGTRRRAISARSPSRIPWEVARGMQDLAMHPTERDEANQQRIFVVQILT